MPPTTAKLSSSLLGFRTAMQASAIASSLELLHFTTCPLTPLLRKRAALFSRLLMAGWLLALIAIRFLLGQLRDHLARDGGLARTRWPLKGQGDAAVAGEKVS